VAISGPQRFHLEFRLQGRREAALLLHERSAAYAEQCSTRTAMGIARVLMNLCEAAGARYCAFPVADAWLVDEDWGSLLRSPLYSRFFPAPGSRGPTKRFLNLFAQSNLQVSA